MIECQRGLFELPDEVTYLACAASSPMLKSVRAAGIFAIGRRARPWDLEASELSCQLDEVRGLFAAVIGARGDDIAINPSASYGLSIAAQNLPIGPGRTIVLLERQFPSNVYPWVEAAARSGARVVFVSAPQDGTWTEAVLSALDSDTAVAALPQCHWIDGSTLDLVAIGRRCRELGAALVLDLSQSAGVVPFDIGDVQPDFLTAASEKWLLGPVQLAFLYVAPRWQNGRPIEFNWAVRRGSERHDRLTEYQSEYQSGARRFDVGERGNPVTIAMATAALRQILKWRTVRISESLARLTNELADGAEALGLRPTPRQMRAPHLLGIHARATAEIPQRLAARRIFVNVRGGVIRVAPHLHIDRADIARLLTALREEAANLGA